jgi:hypothetical protein
VTHLDKDDDALLRVRSRLLRAQLAVVSGDPKATEMLEEGLAAATAIGHRDLAGQFGVELAALRLKQGDVSNARRIAREAMDFARSQDGGDHLRATLEAAHAVVLEADRQLEPRFRVVDGPGDRRETIILVHGTFASPKADERQWYERGSEFCRALDSAMEACGSPARCWAHLEEGEREFFWSGANDWIERSEAAAALAAHVRRLGPQWRYHVVATVTVATSRIGHCPISPAGTDDW